MIITCKLHYLFLPLLSPPPWLFSASPLPSLFAASKLNLSSQISRELKKNPNFKTLQTLENGERVVHLLVEHGCTQRQIAEIMMKQPALLKHNAEKILEPKIQLLKDYGIHGEILAKVLNRAANIFSRNLERCLLPNIALLKNIFKSQDLLVKAISRNPTILVFNHERILKPSLAFWEGCGLSGEELRKFLMASPLLLWVSSLTPAHLDLLHKIGIPPGSKMYKLILKHIACARMETLEAKIQNLQRCGLTPEETLILIRVYPSTLGLSEEKIREKMDFIVNLMEFPANIVVKSSGLLGMSLEKVMKPRFLVMQKIKSMKGVENLKHKPLVTILRMPEPRFLRSIINEHPESSTLYALYQDAVANASASEKIARKVSLFSRVGVVSELKEC